MCNIHPLQQFNFEHGLTLLMDLACCFFLDFYCSCCIFYFVNISRTLPLFLTVKI